MGSRMPELPLRSVRVLEVGGHVAAPFCGLQLADLGAEVIKVEQPNGGDQTRHAAPLISGEGSTFMRLNRNKRSVVIDLKASDGKEIFRKLVRTADIVVENMRPGTMTDLSLDYANVLQVINPRLIYIAISGWGQDGPLSRLAGLDIMAQARSGLMSITGEPGQDPVKVGVPICDLVCGLYGAFAAVSAMQMRNQTGLGQYIDISLYEAGVSLAVWEAGRYFATGEVPQPLGSAHQASAPYQALRSADSWFTVGATSPPTWAAFCGVLGLTRLESDERYKDASSRHNNRSTLIPVIEQITMTRPAAHWINEFEAAGVPCAPIQTYDQVFNDPHLSTRDFFWDARHPTAGTVRQIGSPIRIGGSEARHDRAGPLLGEDSVAVLEALGYSESQITNFQYRKVIRAVEVVD